MAEPRIISLLTDFGLHDANVGIMKGVILGVNPQAVLVDLSHGIMPQNIQQAAFVLSITYRYLPKQTIHLVVIDPGVGTRRRPIVLETPHGSFVAPDNGVLTEVVVKEQGHPGNAGLEGTGPLTLRPPLKAYVLTQPRYWLPTVSATFHGRDIFAPVAAHLSLGVPPEALGEPIESITAVPVSRPMRTDEHQLICHVTYIDHFGNLITDAEEGDLPTGHLSIKIAGRTIEGLSTSYEEGDELLAIVSSSNRLEIATKNGSAVSLLGAKVGDEVTVTQT